MTTRKKIIIGIVAGVLVIAFGDLILSKNRALVDYRPITRTPEPSASPAPSTAPAEESQQPKIKEYRLPPISVEEFTTPNFVSASPVHKEAVALSEKKAVSLKFSAVLQPPSKITVFAGNKVAASGGEISKDGKTLSVAFAAGAFAARNFSSGIYTVYYDACFAGDMCYKGQYAFYGIQ